MRRWWLTKEDGHESAPYSADVLFQPIPFGFTDGGGVVVSQRRSSNFEPLATSNQLLSRRNISHLRRIVESLSHTTWVDNRLEVLNKISKINRAPRLIKKSRKSTSISNSLSGCIASGSKWVNPACWEGYLKRRWKVRAGPPVRESPFQIAEWIYE